MPTGLAASHPLKAYEGKPWLSASAIREWLVANRVEMTWPAVAANGKSTGDDLVHAAMNSRGRYYSATNPAELAANLASALAEAGDNPGDVASVAADAPQVRAGGKVYQATFSPSRWYGRLYAFNQSLSTGLVNNTPTDSTTTNPDQVWEASNKMPTHTNRSIFTSSGTAGTGAEFTWANTGGLTAAQKTALGGDSKILDYLRGDPSNEVANGGALRDRSRYTVGAVTGGVLGDVVNGSPVKGPDAGAGYERLPSTDSAQALYAAYRSGTGLDTMRNTMFLGANDGMLHAFDLASGVERFGYVPNSVYTVRTSVSGTENKLQLLATDLTGTHRFTVDGPPNVSDAFIGGAWKTVLTASTGAGARGVFALDVTNPSVASGFGSGKVMWEFSDADSVDMGHVPAYPHVARMPTGDWVVIFGNGYDSTNGQAKLYILKLSDGTVLREIAVGTAGNNGLGQPNMLLNSNREVIAIYAGDLRGNLWKFDTSSTADAANWDVALGGTPLVTVTGPAGTTQPITVMPEITEHPDGGAMLSFGTGKLFETTDTAVDSTNVNLNTQSIYGIWDKKDETTGIALNSGNRNSLLQVQTGPAFAATAVYAATSASAPNFSSQRGWAIDLESGGERVNLAPQQVKSTLFVVANKPNAADPCGAGGAAKIFVLDPVRGIRPAFAVYDINNDQKFTDADKGLNVRIIRNGLLTQPIFQLPAQASYTLTTGVTTTPLTLFDRGQVTAARTGGVELSRSGGGTLSTAEVPNPCSLLVTAARSDTALDMTAAQVCDPGKSKARISWRQLQ